MRRVAGRFRARDRPPGQDRGDQSFNRTATIVSIVVAVVALAVALFSFLQDRIGTRVLTTPDLEVVLFEPTVKGQISAEATNPVGEVVPVEGGVSGPAVTVAVLNSGEQPGLLTELEVTVRHIWQMNGCWGAGGWVVTAQYDVPLPDELLAHGREPELPRTLRAEAGFEVAGKDVDTFTVAIGPRRSFEGSWPILYAVDVTIVERSGLRIPAGSAVLMAPQDVASVDSVIKTAQEGQMLDLDCVRRNVDLIEAAANTPGKHSPAIEEWRTKLPTVLDARGSVPVTTTPSEPPGSDAVGTWIVQLQSMSRNTTSGDELEQARAAMQERLGLPVSVLNSSDFGSLNPGYWVLYHAANFSDGNQAVAVCNSHGMQDCVGRYLSRDPADRHLICRAPTTGQPSTCRRQ